MMFALALLLAMPAPDDDLTVIAEQVVRCGVDRAQVKVSDPATTLRGPIADIEIATPSAALSDGHLACLVPLATAGNFFTFTDPAAGCRFRPLAYAAWRAERRSESRKWLADHGMLDRLPGYDPAHQSMADFARTLRALCGVAGGVTVETGAEVIRLMTPDNGNDPAGRDSFDCLFSAATHINGDPPKYTVVVVFNPESRNPAGVHP